MYAVHIGVFTMSHIVDAIQVALPFFIIHVLASGLHNLDWVMTEENLTGWPAEELQLVLPTALCCNVLHSDTFRHTVCRVQSSQTN